MCYRFSNNQEEKEFREHMRSIGKVFKHTSEEKQGKFSFFYSNGFDHESLPVITMEKPDEISHMNWGYITRKAKSHEQKVEIWKKGSTLNARSEEIFSTWSYKDSIWDRRCLIPATGFFESRDIGDKLKYPYLVQVIDDKEHDVAGTFCMAGIYDFWIDKENGGELVESFSIITCEGNSMMKKVHVNLKREDLGGRMPLILHESSYNNWLNPDINENDIKDLMQPFPEKEMFAYTVHQDVNRTKNRTVIPDINSPLTLNHIAYDKLGEETAFNLPFC